MKTEIKFGLIISFLGFLWICVEYAVGLQKEYIELHPMITWLALLIPVLGIVYGLKEKKVKVLGGIISYGQAVKTGFFIATVAALTSIPFQFIFHTLVNPDYFSFMISYAEERAISDGRNVEEAVESAKAFFNLGSYIAQSFIGNILGGTFITLIAGAFLRKKNSIIDNPLNISQYDHLKERE